MLREAFEWLKGQAKPEFIEVDGKKYITGDTTLVKPSLIGTVGVKTLTGIRDFILEGVDEGRWSVGSFICVNSHDLVFLETNAFGVLEQRHRPVQAELPNWPRFPFGRYMDLETFIIELQAKFVPSQGVADILRLVSNLRDETVTTSQDDGISQSVTVKKGVAMVERVDVPNPVVLAPYRTFLEVEQPEASFVFRIQRQDGKAPMCGLWDADGGNWQLTAIASIRDWFKVELPGFRVVA